MAINGKVLKIYETLKGGGGDVGNSPEEFSEWFYEGGQAGYERRKSVYDALKGAGKIESRDYETFARWLNLQPVVKAQPTVTAVPVQSQAQVQPQQSQAQAPVTTTTATTATAQPKQVPTTAQSQQATQQAVAAKPATSATKQMLKMAADAFKARHKQGVKRVDDELKQAEDELAELQKLFEDRKSQVLKEWAEDYEKNDAPLAAVLAAQTYTPRQLHDKENSALRVAIRQKEEQIKDLKEERDRRNGKDVGFWRGAGRVVSDPRTWDFGVMDLSDAVTMQNYERYISEHATDGERKAGEAMMKALHDRQETEALYGGNANWRNRSGVIAGEMPPFMGYMAVTSGATGAMKIGGKIATKVAAKQAMKSIGKEAVASIAKNGVKQYVKKEGVKGAAKVAGNWTIKALGTTTDELVFRAPFIANTVQAGKTAADVIDRKLGDVVVDENGNYSFENDKTWGSAIWQGEANAIIENYSEMFGAHLGGVGKAIRGGLQAGAMKGLSKTFGAQRISGLLARVDAAGLSRMMETTMKQFETMGVSDYFGEVTEEYYGQLWRTMLDLDDAYTMEPVYDDYGNQLFDADGNPVLKRTNLIETNEFNVDILGGMALSMGAMGAVKYGVTGVTYANMNRKVNKADSKAARVFGEGNWAAIRSVIDGAENRDINKIIQGFIVDPSLTQEERAAAMTYLERSLGLRGFNLASIVLQQGAPAQQSNQPNQPGQQQQQQQQQQPQQPQQPQQQQQQQQQPGALSAEQQARRDAAKQRLDEARAAVEESFGMESDYYMHDVENDPWALLSDPELTDDQHDAVMDYINAREAVERDVVPTLSYEFERRRQEAKSGIERRTHRDSRQIIPATMKVDDRQVYVIKGNVVMHADGSAVDNKNSSGTLIVMDAKTGVYEFASPDQIFKVGESIDPQAELDAAFDEINAEEEFTPHQPTLEDWDKMWVGDTPSNGTTNNSTDNLNENGTEEEPVAGEASDSSENASRSPRGNAGQSQTNEPIGSADKVSDQLEERGLTSSYDFDDEMEAYNTRGKLASVKDGVARYVDDKGETVIILSAVSDTSYCGLFRDPGSNRWSCKMENDQGKDVWRQVISRAMAALPEGAEFYEKTSVSVDGLRSFAQQLKYGFELTDESYECGLNGADTGGLFADRIENGKFGNIEWDQERIEELRDRLEPYLAALGVGRDAVRLTNTGSVRLRLPVMRKTAVAPGARESQPSTTTTTEGVPNVAENRENGANAVPETTVNGVSEGESVPNSDVPVENVQRESALSRIPVDEKSGEPIFEQAPDHGTAWDGLVEAVGSDAKAADIAKAQVDNITAELKKLTDKKLKLTGSPMQMAAQQKEHQEKINALRGRLEAWNGIAAVDGVRRVEAERAKREAELQAEAAETSQAQKAADETRHKTDHQGNPIDNNGKLITESVNSVDEIADEEFVNPHRSVRLPELPVNVAEAIGTDGKPVIIKKNIFGKNRDAHSDLTPEQSREILKAALYSPTLYGKNQATSRPANWILIQLANKNSALVLEVDHKKDNCEVVNWHYIENDAIERKKRRAIKEGGRILTLESAAANTHDNSSSEDKGNTSSSKEQEVIDKVRQTVSQLKDGEGTTESIAAMEEAMKGLPDEAFSDARGLLDSITEGWNSTVARDGRLG